MYVPAELRHRIRRRARSRCEYCLLHERDAYFSHEPDHIIAEKHGGRTTSRNLAWACFDCNRFKGSDIASIDPVRKRLARLFNPRTQVWNKHFQIDQGRIVPLTAVGRATERLLRLNLPERVEVRQVLAQTGRYPPGS